MKIGLLQSKWVRQLILLLILVVHLLISVSTKKRPVEYNLKEIHCNSLLLFLVLVIFLPQLVNRCVIRYSIISIPCDKNHYESATRFL